MTIEAGSFPEKARLTGNIAAVAIAFLGFLTGRVDWFAAGAFHGATSETFGKRITGFFGKNKGGK